MHLKPTTRVDASDLPVTLAEAKAYLRVTHSIDDDLIETLLRASVGYCQRATGQALYTATWTATLPDLIGTIEIPLYPVTEVSSVAYLDEDGVSQTFVNFAYETTGEGVRVFPAASYSWPVVLADRQSAVTITLSAGHPRVDPPGQNDPSYWSGPDQIRQAILMLVRHYYDTPGAAVVGFEVAEVPLGVDTLLNSERIYR